MLTKVHSTLSLGCRVEGEFHDTRPDMKHWCVLWHDIMEYYVAGRSWLWPTV